MKLPGIEYKTGVQSLGREDVYDPLRKSNAIVYALNLSKEAAQNIYAIYNARRTQIETEQSSLNVQKRDGQLVSDLANKLYYSSEEVPDDVEVRKTEIVVDEYGNKQEVPRKRIPAYEVAPEIYKKIMTSVIEAEAENITHNHSRREWLTEQKDFLQRKYADQQLVSIEAQKTQIKTRQRLNFDEALEARKYTLANELANTFIGTDEERQALRNEVIITKEMDRYRANMSEDSIEGMMADLEFLQKPSYEGFLNEDLRLQFVDAIKRHLSTVMDRQSAADKVADALLKDEVRRTITELDAGGVIDPAYITDLKDKMREGHRVEDPTFNVLTRSLQYSSSANPDVKKFTRLPASRRTEILNQYDKVQKDTWGANHFRNLQAAHAQQVELERTDAMTAGLKTGIVDSKEFKALDYENIGESLASRIPLAERVYAQLGAFTGFLTEGEAQELSNRIEEMDTDAQLTLMANIYDGLGDQAYHVYQQLKFGTDAQLFATAGEAYSENDYPAARRILKGQKLLATPEGRLYLKDQETDLLLEIREQLGVAYENNPTRLSSAIAAARASYAWRAYQNKTEVMDKDLAEQAIHDATGGLVEWAGRSIELPHRDMSKDQFISWIDSLHYSAVQYMDTLALYTPKQVLDGVKDQKFQLSNAGKGVYFVTDDLGRAVRNQDGNLFTFFYDDKMPTTEQVRTQEQAEEAAKQGARPRIWPNLGQRMKE